jgi:AraC-like DNA-binding protein
MNSFQLRAIRLQVGHEWSPKRVASGEGLTFVVPTRGSGQYRSGRGTQTLLAEGLLVIGAAADGQLTPREGEPLAAVWFSVGLEQIFPLLSAWEMCLLPSVAAGFNQGRLYPAASALAIQCHVQLRDVPPRHGLEQRSRLLGIVAAVLSEAFEEGSATAGRSGRPEAHLREVLDRLSVDDLLLLPVEALAVRFGCSRRHLCRQFQRHFGRSVLALRMEMRLLHACSVLRDPQVKVIHVAEQCGFGNLGFFNMVFRRRFGASPGQWRRRMQGQESEAVRSIALSPDCRFQAGGLCPWSVNGKNGARHPRLLGAGLEAPARFPVFAEGQPRPVTGLSTARDSEVSSSPSQITVQVRI